MRPATVTTIVSTGVMLGALGFSGCATRPAPAERAERAMRDAVGAVYRPHREKPVLPVLAETSPPAEFLRFALLNSPTVEAAYYDWFGAVEKIVAMRTPPDPKLTFQMDIQKIVTSLMPGLMFDLPGPGKLAAAATGATAESQAKYYVFEKAVLQTAFVVKRTACERTLLERKLELNRQTLSLLQELEKLAESRNATAQGTLQDVLRAQIEQERMKSELANLSDSRAPLDERFKAALGLGPEQAPPPVMQTPFPATALDTAAEHALAEALARNPELQGMEAEIRLAQADLILARKAGIPDFSAGLMLDLKMVPFLWRPLGSVTLPVWREKIAAEIAAAQAGEQAATARRDAGRIALAVDFAEKQFMVRESERNLRLLRERLLPKTRETLSAAKSAYLTGAADFQSVLEIQRMLLEFGLAEAEAQAQHDIALAELSLVILARPPENAPLRQAAPAVPAAAERPTP